MDRQLKERLVGAAVLVVVAVLVIPELLSGPGRRSADDAARGRADPALKTYTIDLSNPGGHMQPNEAQTVASPAVAEAAPPPEEAAPDDVSVSPPSRVDSQSGADATRTAAAESSARSEPAKPPPAAVPSLRPAPAPTGDWAVQVGSFASQPAAKRLAAQLEKRGYESFITQFRADGRTLHRVRVGPVASREQADAMVLRLKSEGNSATVVANR